jgi:hypothetical protein
MKYLGEKSVSSFFSKFFHVSWYIVLICAVIGGVFGAYFIVVPLDDPDFLKMAGCMKMNLQDKDWVTFRNLPVAVRLLLFPYFIAVVVFLLRIIKKAEQLFTNFKNNILFNKSNVQLISQISKLNIVLSILTFSFGSLVTSVFLFMLCEIFKSATALQEEHDLTV